MPSVMEEVALNLKEGEQPVHGGERIFPCTLVTLYLMIDMANNQCIVEEAEVGGGEWKISP